MKKLLFVMLAAFVFVSCSKDESDLAPNDGQYIARSGDMVVCMQLKGGRCSYFAPYIKGRIFHSWTNVTTSGSYPAYIYSKKILPCKRVIVVSMLLRLRSPVFSILRKATR